MSDIVTASVVPAFETTGELREALTAKNNFAAVDLYPRDGTRQLSATEASIAELVKVQADELVLCNSGMAAVTAAVETCLDGGSVIAFPEQGYSQTVRYISEYLPPRGVKTVRFDSGSVKSIDRILQKHRPDVIITETVGNGPDVPVLDLEAFLQLPSLKQSGANVILDNTLPLSTGLPLGDVLAAHPHVVAVESGTKSYTFNQELCGFVYGKNAETIRRVREYRRTTGSTPNVAAIDRIQELLPDSRDTFHRRNRAIFAHTAQLAIAAFGAGSTEYVVSHPALPTHSNAELAAQSFPDGLTPVFFLQCVGNNDQFDATEQLWQHPVIQDECELGQSFGFDKTRILPDAHYPCIRIAGGATTDTDKLGRAFQEALLSGAD